MNIGACCAADELDTSQQEKDEQIEQQMDRQKKKISSEIRLLLLGAGESGKSTIAKQLRILHKGGFPQEERMSYVTPIHQNLWESLQLLFDQAALLQINIKRKENRHFLKEQIQGKPFPGKIPAELADGIEQVWADGGIQKVFARKNEFQLIDSAGYYISEVRRIAAADYVPSDQDLLRSRIQTTGIIETHFTIEGKKFILIDVGGQRSERKKWMHCFEEVTGVLFCVGISEYDKVLYEDANVNRIHEARRLFHEICQSKWFTQTAMILFLNKDDLFREKIALGHSIRICFADFKGPDEYEPSIKFIKDKFLDVIDPNTGKRKDIYTHVTCATDTTSVKAVFEAVKDFIIQRAMTAIGMT